MPAPSMHPDFARWYSTVSLDANDARREARWEGVSAVVETADRSTIETLVRLAYASRQTPSAAAQDSFRAAFKKADDNFEITGNNRELQILAAITLAVLMQADPLRGAAAALTVTTAGLNGARKPDLPMSLAQLGEAAIARLGEINRKRPTPRSVAKDLPSIDFGQGAKKMREQQNWEGAIQGFTVLGEAAEGAVKTITDSQTQAINALARFQQIQDEELQILWWLIGQRSMDFDCSFDAVPEDVRPLVLSSELADQTVTLPGPPSIKGILSRAGLAEDKHLTITHVINSAKPEWLKELVDDQNISPVSMPLHEAIKRQLETGPGESWIAGWSAATEVSKDQELAALTFGNLFYRERLLCLF